MRGGQKRNESIQKPPDPNVNCKSASSIVPESGPAQLRTQSLTLRKKSDHAQNCNCRNRHNSSPTGALPPEARTRSTHSRLPT